jgi:ParB-like chromosome segregation protein Spo0J
MASRFRHGSVEEVALSRLREWERNPRDVDPPGMADLKLAMEAEREMLWARPLLALPNGTVFCGNMRLRAARELGWTSIPTLFVDIDPERARVWAL